MEKLFNWTIGSFFRTIGRLIAYFAIGAFIAYILGNSNIKLPRITNLFLDHVNAEEIVIPVGSPTPLWFGVSDWSSNWQLYNNDTQLFKNITSTTSLNNPRYDYITFQDWPQTANVDYVEFEFRITQPIEVYSTSYTDEEDISCREWICSGYNSLSNTCDNFYCSSWYSNTGQQETILQHYSDLQQFNFYFEVSNSNGNTRACTINEGRILCPTFGYKITQLHIYTYFQTRVSMQFNLFIMRNTRGYKIQNTFDAITNQTQQQAEQHNETMSIVTDTNTTSEQNETVSFFEGFQFSSDNSGLVGVITAPLRVINSIVNAQFSDLCFTLKSKNVCFPNGNMIWQKQNRDSTWFGSGSISTGIQAFVSLFNLVAGGYILYKMGVSIKRLTEDLINPTNTRIEVMKL